MDKFKEELEELLVKHKLDTVAPAFILASFMFQALRIFSLNIKRKDIWEGNAHLNQTEI